MTESKGHGKRPPARNSGAADGRHHDGDVDPTHVMRTAVSSIKSFVSDDMPAWFDDDEAPAKIPRQTEPDVPTLPTEIGDDDDTPIRFLDESEAQRLSGVDALEQSQPMVTGQQRASATDDLDDAFFSDLEDLPPLPRAESTLDAVLKAYIHTDEADDE